MGQEIIYARSLLSSREARMKRWSNFLAALFFAGTFLPLALAQSQLKSDPLPGETLGPQLIAWSQFQKPQPIPQPLPPPDRDAAQSANQSPATQAPADQQRAPAAQTFTGTIVKDGKVYVLKMAGTTVYQLDDQDRAKQFEGKQVKIAGTLDAKGGSLHVTSIELVS
jgi:Protein of unknown function (DUF5818)